MNMLKIRSKSDHAGFTLVELMITLLISMIVVGSIYTAFISQQHTYIVQDQVSEMQQNLRAGLMLMSMDIRMAGYDGNDTGNYGFTTATSSKCVFTADVNDDGGTAGSGETFTYELYTPAGAGMTALRRIAGQAPIAENIQAIEFYYTLADGTRTTSPANTDQIRAVTVSILACAGQRDRKFTNTMTYTTASGATWGPYSDHYRRRLLITTVNCRNMGL